MVPTQRNGHSIYRVSSFPNDADRADNFSIKRVTKQNKMRRLHWTKFLPEAGTITRRGDEQEYILLRIEEFLKQIRALRQEYKQSEESLTTFCTGPDYWTAEEVETAKQVAAKSRNRS